MALFSRYSRSTLGLRSLLLKEFILNVPRRKQHGKNWRTEFKAFALTPEIATLVKMLVEKNNEYFRTVINANLPLNTIEELPIFPAWRMLLESIRTPLSMNPDTLLLTQQYHQTTSILRNRLKKITSSLLIPSERTGNYLKIFPTRLRRTLATRAAREGFGELIIAELLDHSDTQNAKVYTENVPEHVDAINKAVAKQLAPLAQAFAGIVVTRERDGKRGNDLTSRVQCEQGNLGTCGHHGFCGALAPIACYTCRNFQPWLDGPHEEVLNSLIADRQRVLQITKDHVMASVNDRTILAVTQVIQICTQQRTTASETSCHD